jgi:glycosyltransferase involved in cell wall biosynthesis
MKTPKVSILLPNLNNRPFLDARIRSIRDQTLEDWELVVMDGYSRDGSWEFLRDCAGRDSRIRLYRSAERGIYTNINRCLQLSRGDLIYIATADDTMAPEALDVLAAGLGKHQECDIAHCKLRIIDAEGNPSPEKTWDNFFIIRYFGELIDVRHVRRAPHDGLLHYGGITVYTSLTQLLIRRNLFDKIGVFRTDFGSIADYEWDMRAGLVSDTIHIPEYLATWRVHRDQATADEHLRAAQARGDFLRMSDLALKAASGIRPGLEKAYRIGDFRRILIKERLQAELRNQPEPWKRALVWTLRLFSRPRMVWPGRRTMKSDTPLGLSQEKILTTLHSMMSERGLQKNLVPV